MKLKYFTFRIALGLLFFSCSSSEEKIFPKRENISESVYASGLIKARYQYQAFANANGIVQEIFIDEGDTVDIGTPILSISNATTKLNRENAELNRAYADRQANQAKLKDLELSIEYSKAKYQNDSLLLERQKRLRDQGIGTKVELEQRQLAFDNSKTAFETSKLRYQDLKREIEYTERSASKNLAITQALESDLILKSELKGRAYAILKEKGEMVNPQTPLAVLGSADEYILEMKVDEYDIVKVSRGQKIIVSMDSYKGETYEGIITKVNPIMDEQSKSFTVEGIFIEEPKVLYPNLTLEANIIIQSKEDVLTLPRNFIINDQYVLNSNRDTIPVQLGIMDYQKAEILKGIDENTEIIKPE
ncbi:Multidrug efflux pump subunit AcrA (membrane-fusion protein) [Aquiflexum balticum DSM 16537]|uniref:Multidrug efflux pump subunit AcrA (Membrane-fusion protein) n=1 Tax=Aquiflexum balticum DSM 16537 TaxID=758820 RepID=A0A1W2H923_9BACT|nr:efflux RND transporter periplasmic adaptor subunit [Aquiflexum balticum]SMD45371.1 Multidrug efflux pump subunit AcrA (membrane-fusion protein) [Aquiflexum balticum DSM 16537]